jgi:hypothetical protein
MMQYAAFGLIFLAVFGTGYVFGRVRPFRGLFRPKRLLDDDDPHLRTIIGRDGKPVSIFTPGDRCSSL